jgi:hypothetical protein
VLQRVSRATWRLDQAEREHAWALASVRAEGVSIRTRPQRPVVTDPGAPARGWYRHGCVGELRAACWPVTAYKLMALSGNACTAVQAPAVRKPGCTSRQDGEAKGNLPGRARLVALG